MGFPGSQIKQLCPQDLHKDLLNQIVQLCRVVKFWSVDIFTWKLYFNTGQPALPKKKKNHATVIAMLKLCVIIPELISSSSAPASNIKHCSQRKCFLNEFYKNPPCLNWFRTQQHPDTYFKQWMLWERLRFWGKAASSGLTFQLVIHARENVHGGAQLFYEANMQSNL